MKILDRYEEFQVLFTEIIEGKSYSEKLDCYIKHLNDRDLVKLYRVRDSYLKKFIKGIPTEREKLEQLKKDDLWTDQKEDDLISLKWTISDNKKNVETIVAPEQREVILKIIAQKQEEHDALEIEKMTLMHPTREYYSRKYLAEILPLYGTFKDESMTELKFSQEQFDDFSEEEITSISVDYSDELKKFSSRNMRILAAFPFVLNQISLCKKNPLVFLNKPVIDFTNNQSDLYTRTIRNLNILENTENEPIEIDTTTEEQDILDWYDLNYGIIQGKNKKGNNSEITKATKYVEK